MAKIVDHTLPDGKKIKIKEGYKVIQNLEWLGQDTVAAAIADAEGTTLKKAKDKLKKAKEKHNAS